MALWALRSAGQEKAIVVTLTEEQAAARVAAGDREYTLEPLDGPTAAELAVAHSPNLGKRPTW